MPMRQEFQSYIEYLFHSLILSTHFAFEYVPTIRYVTKFTTIEKMGHVTFRALYKNRLLQSKCPAPFPGDQRTQQLLKSVHIIP